MQLRIHDERRDEIGHDDIRFIASFPQLALSFKGSSEVASLSF